MLTKTETQTKTQTQNRSFRNLIHLVEGLEKLWGVQRIIQRIITVLQIGVVDIR